LPLVYGLTCCATLTDAPKYQLSNGYYEFRQEKQRYTRVFVEVLDDSVRIHTLNGNALSLIPTEDEFFRKRSFDLDVTTVGFRYRPPMKNLPQQLNTSFNGNVFIGHRTDLFQVDFENTPAGLKKINRHTAFTYGLFAGLGGTFVSPWTTNYRQQDEYDGVILSRGLAAMAGINNVTVGLALGWDYLTDRNRSIWIYQNKPWVGLILD
jgi:hypothetical protein